MNRPKLAIGDIFCEIKDGLEVYKKVVTFPEGALDKTS
jgi:hypothetical protein